MAVVAKQRSARGTARRLCWGLARGVALIWLLPALLFNVDWTGHASWQANTAAVLMILGSSLFIEGAVRLRSWVLSPLCVVAALFLVYVNTKQASRTLAFVSEAASEAKLAEIAGGSHLASQRSQLQEQRKAQVQLAGETALGTLEAESRAVQLSDPRLWARTAQCEDVTAPASGQFCTRVAAATAKIEAARVRDKVDADLAALPPPKMTGILGAEKQVPDAYVANIKALANEAGYQPSERLIKAEEAMSRALGFELLAALGPTCWLAFIEVLAGLGGVVSSASTRLQNMRKKSRNADISAGHAQAAPTSSEPAKADATDRWIADDLEDSTTGSMTPRALRKLCHAWCDARGVPYPSEKVLWARMGQRFKHDDGKKSHRPRYLGVRARVKGPILVVNNSLTPRPALRAAPIR